ncbi:ATP-binding protein [Proteiniphilum propionicum]|uniref:ATP-binding protein n=1 Tax=Proteiniphilum propionicum TaxID=2829812 RepID=UPI001EEA2387|nr:ATP-binding protein [Proteiniphilum propionicum]ULB34692.1 response regulator [Proteiniphilum propionicum]
MLKIRTINCSVNPRAMWCKLFINAGFFLLITSLFFFCSENEKQQQLMYDQKRIWEEKISDDSFPTDSIRLLLGKSVIDRDNLAVSVLCKVLGERMREASDFSKAISYHQQGLVAAYKINDTIGIIQALNNIGTNFRRIEALPEASDYHYQALQMAESFSAKNEYVGRKSRAMAINGIGNVHLSFGNLDEAERMFKEALAEEITLGSNLGQAMNYANIGTVIEKKLMYDSAFAYYQRSLEKNMLAKSQLGIGLCYIHLGHIYELKNEYDKAEREYLMAYNILSDISDTWHWLNSTLAIARIMLLKNDSVESIRYIRIADKAAKAIQSPKHLAEVYNLLHEYNIKRGNYATALSNYKKSQQFQDSIQNMQKYNKVIDVRQNYESDKNMQYISGLNLRNEMVARQKRTIIYASGISLILLVFLLIALFYSYMERTRSNKILRDMYSARTSFFTNITHQFRTPLTVILGLSNHMQSESNLTQHESKAYLKAIDRQGAHLLTLTNQLLSMSKINSGSDNPKWQKGNIVVYLNMVIDSFRLYAKEKDIKLLFTSSDPLIEMDFIPHHVDDILQNLLSNAIKFSGPGKEIHVVISKIKNKEAVLKVQDFGDGIPKSDLEYIFDLFYQGNNSERNNGSGIGLSYTRQLVEIMNGKIEVESAEQKGTVFIVSLPLQQSETNNISVWTPKENERIPSSMKVNTGLNIFLESQDVKGKIINRRRSDISPTVLLIEDNDDVVLYIKALLPAEYNSVTARDGTEGLELANELIPDIIISDVMMPNKDGFALCREIRKSALLNHIPIILLTAKTTIDDRLKGMKCGADAYIKKPFHYEELLIQIEALLENRRLLKEKYMQSLFKGDDLNINDININFLKKATDIVFKDINNSGFTSTSLAEKLCISSSQLNRKLSAVAGCTPSMFILRLRVEHAKKKLVTEDKSIGQIAEECGFYDMAYFSRTFKKLTNVTPSQYRRLPR